MLDAHLITDRGLTRERNEDRCGAFTPEDPTTLAERGRLFLVADGMGGHVGGDVAAELTLESLPAAYFQHEWVSPAENLRAAFLAANLTIVHRAAAEPARQGMGAAAVAAVVVAQHAVIGHLGDCRAYRIRAGHAERLTVDHSWVQERVQRGNITEEEAQLHPYRNVLTQALGAEGEADPAIGEVDFLPGDVLLLCSDGLWSVVSDLKLAAIVDGWSDARSAARALVDLALAGGGPDNIAIAVVRALPPDGEEPGDGASPPREPPPHADNAPPPG